jgi:hypothetical protein
MACCEPQPAPNKPSAGWEAAAREKVLQREAAAREEMLQREAAAREEVLQREAAACGACGGAARAQGTHTHMSHQNKAAAHSSVRRGLRRRCARPRP